MEFRSGMYDYDRPRFRSSLFLRRPSFRRQSPPPPYSSDPEPEDEQDPAQTVTTSSPPSRTTDSQPQNIVDADDATISHPDTIPVPTPPETPRPDIPVLPEGEVVATVGSVKIRGTPAAVSQAAESLSKVASTPIRVKKQEDVRDETLKAAVGRIVANIGYHGSWYLTWLAGTWLGAGIWFPALVIFCREIEFWQSQQSNLDREVWFRLFSYALGCGLLLMGIPGW
ncbi:hypothetical protein B0T20DRAFT_150996 [Sordaria brevicollis]|uniref:Uncharacterized protein n=1 Tax=Sordaria brevicollis TaxID=83679 RepID=A0AAE0PIZ5_SORBR|nr:hypothetical protein B0T20DRAFT_150996 [Sordaria brevicollis]